MPRVWLDASKGADLLVIGSRGHGEFVGMLLGSVSEFCTTNADNCPVLVHRPAVAAAPPTSSAQEGLGERPGSLVARRLQLRLARPTRGRRLTMSTQVEECGECCLD